MSGRRTNENSRTFIRHKDETDKQEEKSMGNKQQAGVQRTSREQECHPDNWGNYIWTVTACEGKVVTKTKIPITHSLKGNLLCAFNMWSFKSPPAGACKGYAQSRIQIKSSCTISTFSTDSD